MAGKRHPSLRWDLLEPPPTALRAIERPPVELRRDQRRPAKGSWSSTLLSRYGGAGVVVDEALEVLEFLGQTAPYLALPPGKASLNLLKLIPETGLFLEVEKLVREVERTGAGGSEGSSPIPGCRDCRRSECRSDSSGRRAKRARFWFYSNPRRRIRHRASLRSDRQADNEIATLKQDLADARQRLLSIIEEHHSSGKRARTRPRRRSRQTRSFRA